LQRVVTGFSQRHPRLVRYLLNPESRDADNQQIFMSFYDLNNSKVSRQSGLTSRINDTGSHLFSEISFPPFNLVMSVGGGARTQPFSRSRGSKNLLTAKRTQSGSR
jgi:hypothetical protein